MAGHPDLPVLYAVSEIADGTVTAFDVAADGGLTNRGTWSTGGGSPCHLAVVTPSRGSAWLAVANYGTGSVAGLPLDAQGIPDGRLDLAVHTGHGPDETRQEAPHAHMVVAADEGVLAVDLGADRVLYHPLDPETGRFGTTIEMAVLTPGAGPRHLATDRSGRIHVVGELDRTVTTFDPAPTPWRQLGRVLSSTSAAQPSEIDVSVAGRFLYVGNRGPDTVAVLRLDGEKVELTAEVPSGGSWPRHFAIVDRHLYVANERSDQVAVFTLDPETGVPEPTGGGFSTPTPTCIAPMSKLRRSGERLWLPG